MEIRLKSIAITGSGTTVRIVGIDNDGKAWEFNEETQLWHQFPMTQSEANSDENT